MPLQVTRLSAPFGARITGIDLTRDPGDAEIDAIREALHEHQVIVLPGHALDEGGLVRISRRFGQLQLSVYDKWTDVQHPEVLVLSNVVENGKPRGLDKFGRSWHSDLSYMESPTYATFLYCVEAPPEGGGTKFASMVLAHDALPPDRQADLAGRVFIHSLERQHQIHFPKDFISQTQKNRAPDVTHPVVRRHPATGRKALYLGGTNVTFPAGMTYDEGHAYLLDLVAFATQDRFRYDHSWTPGDLVIWDNQSVMHQGQPFDDKYRRMLYRTSVDGGQPIPADPAAYAAGLRDQPCLLDA